jgi:hypothetical protein
MERRFSSAVVTTVSLLWAADAHVEELKTQAQCSPVVDHTQAT